jgi:hypothetical protein
MGRKNLTRWDLLGCILRLFLFLELRSYLFPMYIDNNQSEL